MKGMSNIGCGQGVDHGRRWAGVISVSKSDGNVLTSFRQKRRRWRADVHVGRMKAEACGRLAN
jgi:hypothetical protein